MCHDLFISFTLSLSISLTQCLSLPLSLSSCQFEIRQLRAHLAQQDLDLVAEREAAMQIHHVWGKQSSSFQEVDGLAPGAPEHPAQVKAKEPGGLAGNATGNPPSPLPASCVLKAVWVDQRSRSTWGVLRPCLLYYQPTYSTLYSKYGCLNAQMFSEPLGDALERLLLRSVR